MSDRTGEGRGGGVGYIVESSTRFRSSGWWGCEGCGGRWGRCGGGDSGRVPTGGCIEDNGVARYEVYSVKEWDVNKSSLRERRERKRSCVHSYA